MAWRIDEHILRGEIDNRGRGRVTGRVWLAGIGPPLVLDLRGGYQPEPGFTIALLKRALEILNDALTSANALAAKPALLPAESLATHRAALFATRESILALIASLRA